MSGCESFLERLYDEDARRALATGDVPPRDLALHLAECAACAGEWSRARADLAELLALREDATPRLTARAARAMSEALPVSPRPLIEWRPVALWGLAGACLGVCAVLLAGPLPSLSWQAALVSAAGAISLTIELTRQGLDRSAA